MFIASTFIIKGLLLTFFRDKYLTQCKKVQQNTAVRDT